MTGATPQQWVAIADALGAPDDLLPAVPAPLGSGLRLGYYWSPTGGPMETSYSLDGTLPDAAKTSDVIKWAQGSETTTIIRTRRLRAIQAPIDSQALAAFSQGAGANLGHVGFNWGRKTVVAVFMCEGPLASASLLAADVERSSDDDLSVRLLADNRQFIAAGCGGVDRWQERFCDGRTGELIERHPLFPRNIVTLSAAQVAAGWANVEELLGG